MENATINFLAATPPPPSPFISRILTRAAAQLNERERKLGVPITPVFNSMKEVHRRHAELTQAAAVRDKPSSARAAVIPPAAALPAALPPVPTPPASVAVPKPATVPPVKPDLSHLRGLARASAAHKIVSGKLQPQNTDKPDHSHLKGMARALAAHAPLAPETKVESADLNTLRAACQAVLGFAPRAESPAAEQRAEIFRAFANAGVEYPGAPKVHQPERTGTDRIMRTRHQTALNKFLAANQTN